MVAKVLNSKEDLFMVKIEDSFDQEVLVANPDLLILYDIINVTSYGRTWKVKDWHLSDRSPKVQINFKCKYKTKFFIKNIYDWPEWHTVNPIRSPGALASYDTNSYSISLSYFSKRMQVDILNNSL